VSHEAYLPPRAPLASDAPALYNLNQIGLAAFLGSPAAGAWLIGHNYRATGKSREARVAIVAGFAASFALIGLGLVIPRPPGGAALPFALAFATRAIAGVRQGALIEERETAKLPFQSWWKVVGISVVILLAMVVCIVPFVVWLPSDN